jgi:hypothetical protein
MDHLWALVHGLHHEGTDHGRVEEGGEVVREATEGGGGREA